MQAGTYADPTMCLQFNSVEELARLTGWTRRHVRRYDAARVRAEVACDAATVHVHEATPEAVEELIRTLGAG